MKLRNTIAVLGTLTALQLPAAQIETKYSGVLTQPMSGLSFPVGSQVDLKITADTDNFTWPTTTSQGSSGYTIYEGSSHNPQGTMTCIVTYQNDSVTNVYNGFYLNSSYHDVGNPTNNYRNLSINAESGRCRIDVLNIPAGDSNPISLLSSVQTMCQTNLQQGVIMWGQPQGNPDMPMLFDSAATLTNAQSSQFLTLRKEGDVMEVSYPLTFPAGKLQASSSLGATASWTDAFMMVSANSLSMKAHYPLQSQQYFRFLTR